MRHQVFTVALFPHWELPYLSELGSMVPISICALSYILRVLDIPILTSVKPDIDYTA